MCPNYDGNRIYLNDLMTFVDLLKSKALAKKDPEVSENIELERTSLLAIYSEIRGAGRSALRRGSGLGLERVIRKNKLDDIEAQILLILAFATIHGDDDLNKVSNIGKMIQLLNQLDPVTAVSYWRKDSRLINRNLVAPSYSYRSKAVLPETLSLEAATLDQLLGRRASGENVPAIHCLPIALCEKLGEYVVGQERARRMIATGVYKHQQICRLNKRRHGVDRLQKSNILMIGSTGTGKTHLCRTLAQILKVPFVICDATQYTETGYVGANVEEMLVALQEKGGGRPGSRQAGIIFIDEIDKIAKQNVGPSHNSNRDVRGLSVQQELLKLLDGDIVHFKDADFDVSNILFIVGGAFPGLEEVITARLKKRQMGFLTNQEADERLNAVALKDAIPEDIMAYGFTPEFVGRFASIVALDGLGRSELVDIMTKPRNSLLSQYQTLFKASGIDLQMPRSALEWVADQAMHSNTGARGLKSILETHLSPILFERSSAVWGHKGPAPSNEVVFDPETGNQAFKIREA